MFYGSELWYISRTELLFLERVHRKILRTIQDLSTQCPSSCLTTLMGVQSIETYIQQRSLAFIVAMANLPSDAVAQRILVARPASSPQKGVVKHYQELLALHNLPDLTILLNDTPSSNAWKSFVKKNLSFKAHLDFIEECESYHLSSCELKPLKPAPHWAVMLGNVSLTRKNNFRVHLLVGCDGLEGDAAIFQSLSTGARPHDSSCKLCGNVL